MIRYDDTMLRRHGLDVVFVQQPRLHLAFRTKPQSVEIVDTRQARSKETAEVKPRRDKTGRERDEKDNYCPVHA